MSMRFSYCIAFIFFLVVSVSVMAQNKEFVINALSDKYNADKYKELYGMLTDDFKKNATEEQITGFFRNNLKAQLGNIISWKQDAADKANYIVRFENGKLLLKLYITKDKNIAGMQWLPYKEKVAPTQKSERAGMTDNPKKTEFELAIDSIVTMYLNDTINSGLSIGVVDSNGVAFYHYGEQEKGSGQMPTNETMYEIGSLTKTYTGILMAHAVNEGKVRLDDDIRKYLGGNYPKLQFAGKPILIKHLASHTSGLPRIPANLDSQPSYDENDPYRNYSKDMIMAYLQSVTPATEPGSNMEYSNLGVGVLGIILETVYKKTLQQMLNEYIAKPAGMKSTYFATTKSPDKNMAKGYREKDGQLTPYWHVGDLQAAGGLRSNMSDMAAYLTANMKDINKDFSLSHRAMPGIKDSTVGYGWMLARANNEEELVWHNGATFGFASFCGFLPQKAIGVVMLSNSGNNVDEVAMGILRYMVSR